MDFEKIEVSKNSWLQQIMSFTKSISGCPLAHTKTWSYIACKNYRNLAMHVAALPPHRWVQRLLPWHPFGTGHTWKKSLMRIRGTQILNHVEKRVWMMSCGTHVWVHLLMPAACKKPLCYVPAPQNELATGVQARPDLAYSSMA